MRIFICFFKNKQFFWLYIFIVLHCYINYRLKRFIMKQINQAIEIQVIKTVPFTDDKELQKAGTSGLRKKVTLWKKQNYVQNFIQSYFNAMRMDNLSPKNTLLVGGDGRYYSKEVLQVICKMACASGVDQLHIAKDILMSTPACSNYIRLLNEKYGNCIGGILLTASHNPGGQHQDFGIKFNSRNGGPALQQFTNSVFAQSKKIKAFEVATLNFLQKIDTAKVGEYHFTNVKRPRKPSFIIKVVENVQDYINLMKKQFDFSLIQNLFDREDFHMVFDGMYGAAGPYAKALFQHEFKGKTLLLNCDNQPDFGGHHPDPNLKWAKQLCTLMGVQYTKQVSKYDFGAACDGDADRNMILGKNFFVTPSDSLAVLAANSELFSKKKLTGVARSMPTSGAVDKVAHKLGLKLSQTPTGWKFFGNLMQKDVISLCGQQSFGTGSSHVRQKDGLWTILAWLQIIAQVNKKTQVGKLLGVSQILHKHWSEFGRNYYQRYDYQAIPIYPKGSSVGEKLWKQIEDQVHTNVKRYEQKGIQAVEFDYTDPIDYSVSKHQGLIFKYKDGSRIVFRQSGTDPSAMTLRVYFQKYEQKNIDLSISEVLKELIDLSLQISQISKIAGIQGPTVIT